MAIPFERPQHRQRARNLSRVMAALRGGRASRSELARALGLDRSTMTHLASALLSARLIVETEEGSASARGGRRPRLLELNPGRFALLGVDIRARDADWTLVNLAGQPVSGGTLERSRANATGEQWLARVAEDVSTGTREFARKRGLRLLRAGLSLPGLVDRGTGTLLRSTSLAVGSCAIAREWARLGCQILVDNDANCSLWNLVATPAGSSSTVLCRIQFHEDEEGRFRSSGAGIGVAFSLGGAVYYGARGAAGELRGGAWTNQDPDQLGLRLDEIQNRLGREAALRLLALELMRALAVVVSSFDPDQVVLTGDAHLLSSYFFDLFGSELSESVMATAAGDGLLQIAHPQQYPAALGAARMAIHDMFEPRGNGEAQDTPDAWQEIILEAASA
jgi:predicted NBD/HSP70 family sugar kinase